MSPLFSLILASLGALERAAGPVFARRSMTPEEMWAAAKFALIAGAIGALLFLSRKPLIKTFPGNDAARIAGNLLAAAGVLSLVPLGLFVLSIGSMVLGIGILIILLGVLVKAVIGWGKES
ncbi:MAG TPA: hypothetical protein VGE07_20815 [Herpetosiphonaceae bacterium]